MRAMSLSKGIALAALLAMSAEAAAVPISVSYSIVGWTGGAVLSGTFVGNDANADNVLRYDELTSFTANFTGNGNSAAFSHTFANLASDTAFLPDTGFEFRFDILNVDLLSYSSCNQFIGNGCDRPTAFRFFGAPQHGIDGSNVPGVGEEFVSALNFSATITQIPEPGSLALLVAGALGIAGFARIRRATA